jgi:hypothetical protein
MFFASYEWPSLVGDDAVKVGVSSPGRLKSRTLLPPHRNQPDPAQARIRWKSLVHVVENPLAEDGEMAHPDRTLHLHQQLPIAHPDGVRTAGDLGPDNLGPEIGRRGRDHALLDVKPRQEPIEHRADRYRLATAAPATLRKSPGHQATAPSIASDSIDIA